MQKFTVNDYLLKQEAQRIAAQLFEIGLGEGRDIESFAIEFVHELCFEAAFGHPWVLYTYNALILCAECDVSEGEICVQENGQLFDDICEHATAVAGYTMLCAIKHQLADIYENESVA